MSVRLQRCLLVLWLVRAIPCSAQDQGGATAPVPSPSPAAVTPSSTPTATPPPIDKRVFGVVPNYRTADANVPFKPISGKAKLTIAFKDSFDWPVYFTSAAFAGAYQWTNQNPSFGQGASGYAKRYAAAYGDQMIGNMMTEGCASRAPA